MTNKELMLEFLSGATSGKNKSNSLFIEGYILYSCGYHYPLATRVVQVAQGMYEVNDEKAPRTTSKHRDLFLSLLSSSRS